MKMYYQKLQKEKGQLLMSSQAGHSWIARADSWLARGLKSERLLADAQKHRLGGIDAKKPIADGAANLGVLKREVTLVVLLQSTKHLVHLPLGGGVEQDVGHVIPQVLAAVAESGESAIPRGAKLRLKDVSELLFADFGHNASFQGSRLSSRCDSIYMHSNHNNGSMSTPKPEQKLFQVSVSKIK